MESKGLRVNVAKTKVMISGCSVGKPQEKGKFPCSVCGKGVWSNFLRPKKEILAKLRPF